MKYEVRYQVDGDEHATSIDAEDAATAAQAVQDQYAAGGDTFELIQVQLLDDMPEYDLTADETVKA